MAEPSPGFRQFAVDEDTPGGIERPINSYGFSPGYNLGPYPANAPFSQYKPNTFNPYENALYPCNEANAPNITDPISGTEVHASAIPSAPVFIKENSPTNAMGQHLGMIDRNTFTIWDHYNMTATKTAAEIIKDANDTAQLLLTFAGLLSAALAAFIAIAFARLSPDPNDTLLAILMTLRNDTISMSTIQKPPPYGSRVNAFLFGAISVSMVVAVLCIFVNQWARSYQREIATHFSSPHHQARLRYFLHRGVEQYNFVAIVDWLSVLMLLAVILAMIGLFDLIFSICPGVGTIPVLSFMSSMAFILWKTFQSIRNLDAPFRSPLSHVLGAVSRIVVKLSAIIQKASSSHLIQRMDAADLSHKREANTKEYVKSCLELDLQIIIQIMCQADKTTERGLMDSCFAKITSFTWVAENVDTSGILSNTVIFNTSIFLAKTCVQKGPLVGKLEARALVPTRFDRALILSEFLIWFLSFDSRVYRWKQRDMASMIHWTNMLESLGSYALGALAENAPAGEYLISREKLIHAVCTAYYALGLVEHFRRPPDSSGCTPCWLPLQKLRIIAAASSPLVGTQFQSENNGIAFFQAIVVLLSTRGRCMRASPGSFNSDCEDITSAIKQWFQMPPRSSKGPYVYFAEECQLLLRILEALEARASDAAKQLWFKPILDLLRSISTY